MCIRDRGYYDEPGYWHYFSETDRDEEYYDLQYALLTGEDLSYDFSYGGVRNEKQVPPWTGMPDTDLSLIHS